MRRGVGYALRQEGRLLADFVGYCQRRGITRVTTEAALAWATPAQRGEPAWWATRLAVVRGFAAHLQTVEAAPKSPRRTCCPAGASRTTPYLFSPTEITALIAAARALAHPLRAASFETLIGLMAVTGLRTGEAMALDRADVDLDRGHPHHPAVQVRQVPAGAAARDHRRQRSRPTRRAATSCARARTAELLPLRRRHPAQPHQHLHHVRRPARSRRDRDPARSAPTAALRPAPHASPSPP